MDKGSKKKEESIHGVAAVIRMTPADTSLTNALATCVSAAGLVKRVFVVDGTRGRDAYKQETFLERAKSVGIPVSFVADEESDSIYQRMHEEDLVMEIPPGLYATREHVQRLADAAKKNHTVHKSYATAPVYARYPDQSLSIWECTAIVLHTMWSLISLLFRGRLYRDTYMRMSVLNKEMKSVSLPVKQFSHGERSAFVYSSGGVQLRPPPGRSALDNLLYMVNRESFTTQIWFFMFVMVLFLGFPYHVIVVAGPREAFTHAIRSSQGILRHAICFLLHLYYGSKYFSGYPLTHTLIFALISPFILPITFLLAIYAKTIWRGYGGDSPTLEFPEMSTIPLFTEYISQTKNTNGASDRSPPVLSEEDGRAAE